MKKNALVVDSSFGIKNGDYPHVYVLPLIINELKNGVIKTYHDGVDINATKLIKKMQQGIDIKTSQSIPLEIHDLLFRLTKEYENIYAFPIPSSISGGFKTWKMIAQEFKRVIVFEQQMVALPAKWTVMDLAKRVNKLTQQEIEDYLKNAYTKRIGLIVVPDVKYLIKGGRVSNFKGMLIKLFNLKLIVTLYNDGLNFFDKTSSINGIIKIIPKCFSSKTKIKFNVNKLKRFSLFYSRNNDQKYMVNDIVKEIKKTYPTIEIVENEELPAIIAAHTGSNYIVVVCEFK